MRSHGLRRREVQILANEAAPLTKVGISSARSLFQRIDNFRLYVPSLCRYLFLTDERWEPEEGTVRQDRPAVKIQAKAH